MLSTSASQSIKPSYIREILKAASEESVISFAGGLPDESSFPMELMAPAFKELQEKPQLFQYSQTIGYAPLLDKLKEDYQVSSKNNLMVTSGSQQGLDLITRAFIKAGDKILVESPCYLGALQVFELAKADILTVDRVNGELDFAQMEAVFLAHDITCFYFVADFQNPTGVCYSRQEREKIASLCRQFNVTIVEDAPYRELRFEGESLPLVSSYYPENAIVLRSFSKVVSPGLRLATLEASQSIIDTLVKIKQITDLHSNVPSQFVVLQLLNNPLFLIHQQRVKAIYQKKKSLMIKQLLMALTDSVTVNNVEGGMFLWVHIESKNKLNMLALAQDSLAQAVAVVPGEVFNSNTDKYQPNLRLNFSHASESEIIKGVEILAKVINSYIQG
ncbi:PLP-dependent aminotransferase family protein [Gammaproteobacteria bacterium AS21]